ncbi:hypothetical protein AMR41_05675 [Hapalosiphon sp. MRB220]|nr:hypothetical protein AMR41_05675 [Hapalosiphon sp. MRB220]
MINWTGYLQSLCDDDKYVHWQQYYTVTDVVGCQPVEQKAPPWLFDLMVQMVQSEKEESREKQEKIERLGVLEGLRKYAPEHVLLVGRPGSGKSTALVRLLLQEAQTRLEINFQANSKSRLKTTEYSVSSPFQRTSAMSQGINSLANSRIPVLVELRYYQTSVVDLIRSFLKQHGLLLDTAEIEKLVFEQQLLLLFDGVNELPSEAARRDLLTFRQENITTPMIFTTRDIGVGGDLNITKKLEMQPLTEPQMQQFVKNYLPGQGEQMLRQLGGRLREFGETPLLLWMLCSLFQQTHNIPPNLGMVFRQFTQFCENQRLEGVLVTDNSRRWWRLMLQDLALRMTQGKEPTELQVAISREEAEEILTAFLQQEQFDQPRDRAISWLNELLKYHLIQLGAGDTIEFRHQLIQEYYTAESLLKQLPDLLKDEDRFKREYLNYLKWTEPLVLMLELVEDEKQALRIVELALEVDLQLGARLAGGVKANFQHKTVALVAELKVDEQEIPPLLKIELLGITRSEQAIAPLRQYLNHQDAKIRASTVSGLIKINSKKVIPELIKVLEDENTDIQKKCLSDQDILNWMRIVEGLGKFSKQDAISQLHDKLLKGLENPFCFFRLFGAGQLLGTFDNKSILAKLLKALEDRNSDYRRQNAAFILADLGNKEVIPKLLQALEKENISYVRENILHALVDLDQQAAIPTLLKDLQDTNKSVRENAAKTLIQLNNQASVFGLYDLLTYPDENVSWCATIVLGKLGRKEAFPRLIERLTNEDSGIRETAATLLGELGFQEAIPALCKALEDKYYFVRRSAALALAQFGCEEAIPELFKALVHYATNTEELVKLENQKQIFRRISEEELNKLGSEEAIERWQWECNNFNFTISVQVAEALGNIGTEEVMRGLIQELENYNLAAAIALGQLGRQEAIPQLLNNFRKTHPELRKKIVELLVKIGTEEVVKELIKALDDEDYDVHNLAAKVLMEIGNAQLISFLWQMRLQGRKDVVNIIIAIQERCKFYNYTLTQLPLSPATPNSICMTTYNILHLSDLHFGTYENANNWYNQLAEDLYQELKCSRLDVLILSGDIANKSTPEEYNAAKQFLNKISDEFQLQPEQIVIVPGNHDLNWGLAKKAYQLIDIEDLQGTPTEGFYIKESESVIRVRDEEKYQQRFTHFSQFYQTIKNKPYPLEYEQQAILHHFPAQNLLILGLNSAWQLDHHYKSRASIKPEAISNAITDIRKNQEYQNCLKIAVWHHPLTSAFEDRITDHGFMEELAKARFRFALHGHIHKAETSLYKYDLSADGRKLDIICAGTFGAPIREWIPGYPLQYNLLKFADNQLTVHTRRREELNGAWKPDARWQMGAGQNPLPYYEIAF